MTQIVSYVTEGPKTCCQFIYTIGSQKLNRFANQDEWIEGTLVEEIREQEKMENAMKDLEKTLDLDSFG